MSSKLFHLIALFILITLGAVGCESGGGGDGDDESYIYLNPTGLKVFIAGETNPYAVYGSNDIPTDNDDDFAIEASPEENGYLLLGTATSTAEFSGTYNYYLITPFEDKPITIDALQLLNTDRYWSGRVSLPEDLYSGVYSSSIEEMEKLYGSPDGESAQILAGEIDGWIYLTPFYLLPGDGWALPDYGDGVFIL